MRKLMTFAVVSALTVSATGCSGCWDHFCQFERQKNEALFGWMRPQPQQQTVCYEPSYIQAQPQGQCCEPSYGAASYGTPVITNPGACCGDTAGATIIQSPGPTPMPQ